MAKLNAGFAIVQEDGTMEDAFRDEMTALDLLKPITGAGSPEGVIQARRYQVYLDTTAAAGSIEYRKMQSEIAGDRLKGWLKV